MTGGTCTASSQLAAGGSCTVVVAFQTPTSGTHTAALHLPTNSPSTGDVTVQLSGTALTPANILVRPGGSDLGDVTVGQTAYKTITVANTGQLPLDVNQVTMTGDVDFLIVADQDFCSDSTVSGQTNCTVQVAYTPTVTSPETATLSIPSDALNNTGVMVALTATGTAAIPGPTGASGTNGTDGAPGTTGSTGAGPQGPAGASPVTSLSLSSRTLKLSPGQPTHVTLQFKLASAGPVKVSLQREVKRVAWRAVGSRIVNSARGPNSLAIGDRFAGHKLTAGRYRVVLRYKHGTTLSSPVGRVFTVAAA